jgi:hypothetical protein
MFIGHSEIAAFLLHRFNAHQPAPLLQRWILPLHSHKLLSTPPLLGTSPDKTWERRDTPHAFAPQLAARIAPPIFLHFHDNSTAPEPELLCGEGSQ